MKVLSLLVLLGAAEALRFRPRAASPRAIAAAFGIRNRMPAGTVSPLTIKSALEESGSEPAPVPAKEVEEAPAAVDAEADKKAKLINMLKVGGYFALWYILNIGYNIYNKKVLNAFPLPWTMALMQLAAGLLVFVPLWATGLRKAPKLSIPNVKTLLPLASMHTAAHATAVLSLGAGAVSFTHIVKAAEPAFSALFAALFLGQVFAAPVYAALVPVIGGVAVASMKELSFSWMSFGNAMGSNTFSALRGIFAKKNMGNPVGENMNAANLYAVLTCMGIGLLFPIALLTEGSKWAASWAAGVAAYGGKALLAKHMLFSGLFYYLYNEVAFLALSKVNPVTHAVGNTIKRVVVILASVVVFGTQMTPTAVAGSTVAIAGTLGYALAKNAFPNKEPEKK
uniref:Sugar phosphate transporter domain-containing protein n=1 Tax=Phaeomonas parva TaxID=124430 RepID=A0A6U4KWF3_9STRA|mmetsp:Transcript_7716/g.22263  ORF Transcript_7716/g.22263 Transcript_7716/m.22263 type:complete len:396 (+) Transcript_7716:375-1562(+)